MDMKLRPAPVKSSDGVDVTGETVMNRRQFLRYGFNAAAGVLTASLGTLGFASILMPPSAGSEGNLSVLYWAKGREDDAWYGPKHLQPMLKSDFEAEAAKSQIGVAGAQGVWNGVPVNVTYVPHSKNAGKPLVNNVPRFQMTEGVDVTGKIVGHFEDLSDADPTIFPSDDIVIDDSGMGMVTMSSTLILNSDIIDKLGSAGNVDFMLVSDGGAGAGVFWKNPFENQYIGYKSFQTFVWTNGSPVAYTNWLSATASFLPFDPTPLIETGTYTGTPSNYNWTCTNAAGGPAGQVATFTLGASGEGTWKIRTCQHWFDQTSQVEMRVSLQGTATGGAKIDIIDQKSTELTGDKIFYGELVQECGAGDTIQIECEFTVGGVNPFPSDTGNRPIEVTFERIV